MKSESKTGKQAVDSLTEKVKLLERRLKKCITANLNKLTKIEETCNSTLSKLSKKTAALNKSDNAIKQALLTQLQAFKGIEETFYVLYHNIQRNQYLYANKQEAYCEDNLDLKKQYKEENKGFEDKCKDIEERFFSNIFYQALGEMGDKEEFQID